MKFLAVIIALLFTFSAAQAQENTVVAKPCPKGVIAEGVIDRACALHLMTKDKDAEGVYAALVGVSARISGVKIDDLTVDEKNPVAAKLTDRQRKMVKQKLWAVLQGAEITSQSNDTRLQLVGQELVLTIYRCRDRLNCEQLSSQAVAMPKSLLNRGILN